MDGIIQKVTCVNPANAIVRQVQSDLEEQRRASGARRDSIDKDVQQAIEGGKVPMSLLERHFKGEDVRQEILYAAAIEARESTVRTERGKALELQLKTGGDWKSTATVNATNAADAIIDNMILKGADSQKLFEKAAQWSKENKIPTPEEKEGMLQELNRAIASATMAADAEMHKPQFMRDGALVSYAALLGPDEIRKIKEQSVNRLNSIKDMITNNDYGLIGAAARHIKARKESTTIRLMSNAELGVLMSLPEGGKEWIGPILEKFPGFTEGAIGALRTELMLGRSKGEIGFTESIKKIRDTKEKIDPKTWQNEVNSIIDSIADPKAPLEIRKNNVKAFFGDKEVGSLGNFLQEQQARVFSHVTSPRVTEAVKALKDPEAWRQYENWTRQSFNDLLKTQFQSLGKATANSSDYVLKWDGVQLRPSFSAQGEKKWNDSRIPYRINNSDTTNRAESLPDFAKVMGSADWKAVNDINLAIRSLGPVVKQGGGKVEDVVMQILQNETPKSAPNSILDNLKALFSGEGEKPSAEQSTKDSAQDEFRRSRSQPKPQTPGKQSALDFDNATMMQASFTEGGSSPRNSRRDGPLDFDNAKLVDDVKVNPGVNLDNVDPALRTYGESLSEKWGIAITSGHRDPFRNREVGGASGSQHIPGKALDFSLRGLPVEDRMALIDEILANPEVGGIGMYDNGSIHVDYRKGGKAAWGGDRSSLDGTPTWFRQRVERWRGKDI